MPTPWEQGFVEIADRCYVARYREWDVTVGVVIGSSGALVVDTRASLAQGQVLRQDIQRLPGAPEVRWVVNTHEHFDHVFGNGAFEGATGYAHENALDGMPASADRVRQEIVAEPGLDPDQPSLTEQVLGEVAATELVLPSRSFSSAATIDLGDRYVELLYPGRGHTSGDAVMRVPDCDVLFAGDLVEESAERDATPGFGADCWPLEWASTLDFVIGLLGARSLVVPGHGAVVGRAFVEQQRDDISSVAEMIRALVSGRVPQDQALSAGAELSRPGPLAAPTELAGTGWVFDPRYLVNAVARGYEQLRGRSQLELSVVERPTGE